MNTEAWNVLRTCIGNGIRPPIVRLLSNCRLKSHDLVHSGVGHVLPHSYKVS